MDETAGRRRGIDVARVLALLIVVGGHLLLAVIDRPGRDVRGANLLALHPGLAFLAALAPMPLFFAAGGWANATADPGRAAERLRRLVGLAAVVVAIWSVAVLVARLTIGDAGIVGDGARIATQPIWFLAAYLPMAAGGAWVAGLARSHGGAAVAVALAALGVLDLARFGAGAPQWLAWPGFFLAWGVPWLLGAWWRDRVEGRSGEDERRTGLALLLAGGVGAIVLVRWFGYSPALIDAVPGARSNTTPPTLYTAVAGIAQVGALMLVAGALDRIGARWRKLWSRAGEAAVGIYLWHLTGLALAAALVAAGLPAPERFTTGWWLSRPLWWALVLGITAVLIGLTSALRPRTEPRCATIGPARTALGVAVGVAGAALVGLRGPRTTLLALACAALLGLCWWTLAAPVSQSPTAARLWRAEWRTTSASTWGPHTRRRRSGGTAGWRSPAWAPGRRSSRRSFCSGTTAPSSPARPQPAGR